MSGKIPFTFLFMLLLVGCTAVPDAEISTAVATRTKVAAITPTAVLTPTPPQQPSPSATAVPSTLPPAQLPPENLLLYSQREAVGNELFWSLRAYPPPPLFDQPVFATFYGRDAHLPDGPGLYFYNFAPQVSPDGRYLALPGIGGYDNPAGDLGTGFWLADLQTGSARLLLPQAHPFTWSPDSQAITFADDGVLYTLHVADETAVPVPLFSHPDLVDLWARWSPDGPIGTIRWTADNAHLVIGGGTTNAPIWLLAAQPGSVPEVVVEQGVLVDVVSAPDTAVPATISGWLP